jgi:CGNR zinc finger
MRREPEAETWVHEDEDTAPAPGDLELLRSFLSLHEHPRGTTHTLAPTRRSVRWWLGRNGLVDPSEGPISSEDADRALALLEALRAKLHADTESRSEPGAGGVIDRVADDVASGAGLRLRFSSMSGPRIEASAGGASGALARLLGIAFIAEIDGTWSRLKECGDSECRSVFFDRSKNRSGRWCSMRTCGNRNKARAWRERRSGS